MSKGCDLAFPVLPARQTTDPNSDLSPIPDYIYRGDNPAVITDATCYMDWIAEQYGLTLPSNITYKYKASCHQSTGDIEDFNQTQCRL